MPFQARQLRAPNIVFIRDDIDDPQELLQTCGFLIPSELEQESDYTFRRTVFSAERYGGQGIGPHGGGVRCGIRGKYQVKGIGSNQLRGPNSLETCFWHAHGGVHLAEAIQEAIWGEVFQEALPYGALRTDAIILTGTKCWYESEYGKKIKAPRALIVRRPVIRPAHFMRAVYHRPDEKDAWISDVARVRAAIAQLPGLLPSPLQMEHTWERLESGLHEIAYRYALQCASAHSKRLMHGAINASNIGLDGRWLDYGTATALPSYVNIRSHGLPPHLPTLWEEHLRLPPVLADLLFYSCKYFPSAPPFHFRKVTALTDWFSRCYETGLSQSLLLMAGLLWGAPADAIAITDYQKLGRTLLRILRQGTTRRIISGVPDLSIFGESRLGNILVELARWCPLDCCDTRLSEYLPDTSLRSQVIREYNAVLNRLKALAEHKGVRSTSVRRWLTIHAEKMRRTMPELYRNQLRPKLARIMWEGESPAEIEQHASRYIGTLRDSANILYRPSVGDEVAVWKTSDSKICYHANRDLWIIRQNGRDDVFYPFGSDKMPLIRQINQFYNCDFNAIP